MIKQYEVTNYDNNKLLAIDNKFYLLREVINDNCLRVYDCENEVVTLLYGTHCFILKDEKTPA